jgi:hypothetical protein
VDFALGWDEAISRYDAPSPAKEAAFKPRKHTAAASSGAAVATSENFVVSDYRHRYKGAPKRKSVTKSSGAS